MSEIIHGSLASFDGKGILIVGEHAAGKTTLLLELISLGAAFVSDDAVEIQNGNVGKAPDAIRGLIENKNGEIDLIERLIPDCKIVDSVKISLIVRLGEISMRLRTVPNIKELYYEIPEHADARDILTHLQHTK